jgi:hypothetical protein
MSRQPDPDVQPALFGGAEAQAPEPDPIPEGWPKHLADLGLGPLEMRRRQLAHLEARYADQARRGAQARALAARLNRGLQAAPAAPAPSGTGAAPAAPSGPPVAAEAPLATAAGQVP